MMNLLPPGARDMLRKEYWLRVMSVWALLAACALAAVAALLVPSYMLIESEEAALAVERAAIADKNQNASRIEEQVKYANQLAAALRTAVVPEAFTPIVRTIDEALPPGVSLTSYRAARTDTSIEQMTVVGVANSRDALIAFERALEASDTFTNVEVPIEDLIKERDLPFRIIMTVAKSRADI